MTPAVPNASDAATPIARPAVDVGFPAANRWGIPDLLPELQGVGVPLPVWAWGSRARTRKHTGGTYHFYVDDSRFTRLVREPDTVAASECAAAVEVNFSLYDDTPAAVCLHSLYAKRWLARYWQAQGVRIFVDLNVPEKVLDMPEFRFGIPSGWRAFATRGYDRDLRHLDREYAWAATFAERPPIFLVVGGGREIAAWCTGHTGIFHSSYADTKEVHREQRK